MQDTAVTPQMLFYLTDENDSANGALNQGVRLLESLISDYYWWEFPWN